MKQTAQIDWRQWRDYASKNGAIEVLGQLLAPFGVSIADTAPPGSDYVQLEATSAQPQPLRPSVE